MENYTALFVDDEPHILAAIQRIFRDRPYRVLTAESAERALALMEEEDVAVLVTDQRMPGMSGIELCEKAAELHPFAIRLMLSAYARTSELIEALSRGTFYRLINKPSDFRVLLEVVDRAFEQIQVIRCFQKTVDKLNQEGENYDYHIDYTRAMISIGFNGNGYRLTREKAAGLLQCVGDQPEGLPEYSVTSAVLGRDRNLLTLDLEFGAGRRLGLELAMTIEPRSNGGNGEGHEG